MQTNKTTGAIREDIKVAGIACPHCEAKTFNWLDKYKTGKWMILTCRNCGGRVCAQPIVLSILYFLYVWDLMLFGYLAYIDSASYLIAMLVIWLILDYFSLYVPLTALRSRDRAT